MHEGFKSADHRLGVRKKHLSFAFEIAEVIDILGENLHMLDMLDDAGIKWITPRDHITVELQQLFRFDDDS